MQNEQRITKMLKLIKYIVKIRGQRITENDLKEIVKININYCKNYTDDEYDRIIKHLYENQKNIPTISDIKKAYEDIFYKTNSSSLRQSDNKINDDLFKYFIAPEISRLRIKILSRFADLIIYKGLGEIARNKIFYEIGALYWYGQHIVNKMSRDRYKKMNSTKEYNDQYEFDFQKFIAGIQKPLKDFRFKDEEIEMIKKGYENGGNEYEKYFNENNNEVEKEIIPEEDEDNSLKNLDDIEVPF